MAICGYQVAPVLIRKLGERMAMILTSFAYGVYVLSVSYIITPLVLLTSINIGLCGGVSDTAAPCCCCCCCCSWWCSPCCCRLQRYVSTAGRYTPLEWIW